MIIICVNLLYIKGNGNFDGDLPQLKIDLSKYGNNYVPFNIFSDDDTGNLSNNRQILSSIDNYFQSYFKQNNLNDTAVFNIKKDMNTINFCLSYRVNLESYLSCVSRNSFKIYQNEHMIAFDLDMSILKIKPIQGLRISA